MNPDDYGWFTPAEFKSVLDALNKNQNPSSPTILVGGQALIAWIKHYDIPIPNSETPALTQDVDFFGSQEEAKLLAKEIGATKKGSKKGGSKKGKKKKKGSGFELSYVTT